MRHMPWDEDLWQKLKDAVSPMPPLVRQRALKTIIEASEALAQERDSQMVQEQDLIKAAKTKTPVLARRRMLDAMGEMRIGVEAGREGTKR